MFNIALIYGLAHIQHTNVKARKIGNDTRCMGMGLVNWRKDGAFRRPSRAHPEPGLAWRMEEDPAARGATHGLVALRHSAAARKPAGHADWIFCSAGLTYPSTRRRRRLRRSSIEWTALTDTGCKAKSLGQNNLSRPLKCSTSLFSTCSKTGQSRLPR
jgi:hypothetical protein